MKTDVKSIVVVALEPREGQRPIRIYTTRTDAEARGLVIESKS